VKIKRPARTKPRIELVPMIDTIFFVLVFFVVASLSMVHQRGFPVALPTASAAERPERERVDVTIRADGRLYLDGEPVAREELAERLRAELARSPEVLVLVNADREAEHGHVVEVMDAARKAGARHLTIGVRPSEGE
jgi:biopolymer transport protein ExbD